MSTQKTTWILELIDKVTSPMRGLTKSTDDAGDSVDKLGKGLKGVSAIDIRAISESVGDIANAFNEASEPGIKFDSSLKDIEAITGVTGDALDKLGDRARSTAKDFGGDASEMMESYKGVLSRLGPDIAKNQEALGQMGTNIATLSKTMENDAVGAMDALTTSVLQFGVDLSNPQVAAGQMTRMMNVMAAGAKEGASEVTQISEALKQAGVQALNSNVSFEETNSALQALAQGGKFGSEAGVALRNVLGKMAGIDVVPKEAAEKLKALGVNYDIVGNKSLPFTTRLRELGKAQGDATIMAQIFGVENAAAAQILLRSADYQDNLTQKITGTNTAVEQADVIMGSYTERVGRLKAWFSDLGISVFSVTQHILPFVNGLASSVMMMANLANAGKGVQMLMTGLKGMPVIGSLVTGAFGMMSAGATALTTAIGSIPIIGWIAIAITAIGAFIAYLWNTNKTFRSVLTGVWESVKAVFTGIGKFIGEVAKGIWHILKGIFNPANWVDKNYKFADGLKTIGDAARKYGEQIGQAYGQGREKGLESYYKDHPEERPKAAKKSGTVIEPKKTGVVTPAVSLISASGGKGSGLSGSGIGGVKTINQKIEIKNYFTVSEGSNVEAIAEKVIRVINDRLRDDTVALQF